MSSRVYRKLHGKNELESLHDKLATKNDNQSDDDDTEFDSGGTEVVSYAKPSKSSNVFALAMVSGYMVRIPW